MHSLHVCANSEILPVFIKKSLTQSFRVLTVRSGTLLPVQRSKIASKARRTQLPFVFFEMKKMLDEIEIGRNLGDDKTPSSGQMRVCHSGEKTVDAQ